MTAPIRAKDRDAVIQSLRAGVVPRARQHLTQVGRGREVETLVGDIDRVADGGSTFRFVIGEYGAGKTFFLNLIRAVAMDRKLIVGSADLNPDRRLHASGGGLARSLYAELMRNLAMRTKPEGGALAGVVEKFIATAKTEAKSSGRSTEEVIRSKLEQLTELVNSYDFAEVIAAYCRGADDGQEQLKSDAIRWLRGEFSTRTDARAALGVRSIVDDASVYDQLKLMARFVRLAGFGGCSSAWMSWGQSVQTRELTSAQCQLRAVAAHAQRLAPRHGRGPRIRSRRHTRIPDGHPARRLQVLGIAKSLGTEHLRGRWSGRLQRPRGAFVGPYDRRLLSAPR